MIQEIRNPAGERLAYSWTPGAADCRDVVVIGHGLTSDKERPWSQRLSSDLAAAGIASLRLAFSGNGDSEGRFEDSNITKEIADLGAVLQALGDRRVSYVGHSMGAAVGVLCAVDDPRIHALVSLSGMVHTRAFVDRLFGNLVPGDLMLDKPGCPLTQAFLDDLHHIDTIRPAAARVQIPWQIVHGNADTVVPVEESIDIAAEGGDNATLVVLSDVDHSFTEDGVEPMIEAVVPWLVRTLG